ncbi:8658_t:CDS:2 [Ambispora gerdemannii]|uniref:8658_t:CDS:1 n=1 Tax=Ambispora gerdemannii TaxID=144530 RepID=A0A9N9BGC5_9GLOM|nr:8658_t:CDS:2 [Ambispora gerdemannii]
MSQSAQTTLRNKPLFRITENSTDSISTNSVLQIALDIDDYDEDLYELTIYKPAQIERKNLKNQISDDKKDAASKFRSSIYRFIEKLRRLKTEFVDDEDRIYISGLLLALELCYSSSQKLALPNVF